MKSKLIGKITKVLNFFKNLKKEKSKYEKATGVNKKRNR